MRPVCTGGRGFVKGRIGMAEKIRIALPEAVAGIIGKLHSAGYEAWAVGGCVRDSILGRKPDDWDITTSAKPEEVKALFERTVDTGIAHGTVTVLIGRAGFEVTTYRIDGAYEDGRHPKEVAFTSSLQKDLERRDFTVNAMAYNETKGLVDLFDGLGDMKRRVLRCVGDPAARFSEDALRMMRAVRFSAQLGYDIEIQTRDAIRKMAPTLEKISAERIQTELVKLLCSDHPQRIGICYETGLTAVFFPEFDRMMQTPQHNPHHCYSVGEHTIHTLAHTPADRVLRLAALFHDAGKPETCSRDAEGIDHFYGHGEASARIARRVMRRLKFDNATTDRVVRLAAAHDIRIESGQKPMRKAMNRLGEDLFPDLFVLKAADLEAQSGFQKDEKRAQLERMRADYEEVLRRKDCVSLKDLAINGSDLIAAGMRPGRELGAVLQALLAEVLEDPSLNDRDYLLKEAFQISISR